MRAVSQARSFAQALRTAVGFSESEGEVHRVVSWLQHDVRFKWERAIRKRKDPPGPDEKFYPPGMSFPVTAFLRVLPDRAAETVQRSRHLVRPKLVLLRRS